MVIKFSFFLGGYIPFLILVPTKWFKNVIISSFFRPLLLIPVVDLDFFSRFVRFTMGDSWALVLAEFKSILLSKTFIRLVEVADSLTIIVSLSS